MLWRLLSRLSLTKIRGEEFNWRVEAEAGSLWRIWPLEHRDRGHDLDHMEPRPLLVTFWLSLYLLKFCFSKFRSHDDQIYDKKQIVSHNLSLIFINCWQASTEMRIPKVGETEGFNFFSAWGIQLDHLHPFEPLLFKKISIFFLFILGGQFLLPQMANNGKREFFQPQKWMRQSVFSELSSQTGPFASL